MPAHFIAEEGPLAGLILNLDEGSEWIVGRDPDEADFVIEDSKVSRKHARIAKKAEGYFIENLSRSNPLSVNGTAINEPTLLADGDTIQIGSTALRFSTEAPAGQGVPSRKSKKKKPAKGGYEDIFGDIETPELPPEPEPVEEIPEEKVPEPEEPAPAPAEKAIAQTAYDTIFEDLGSESQLPFNLLAETPLVLKVIGGPNAGAEIGLEKGRTYVIGKDPNTCDIVFQDLSVSRNHARLTVSPEGILEIEDLHSKNGTIVNNTPITEKSLITAQDTIAMGTTIFMIIDREAAQETIYAPKMPVYEAAPSAAAAAAEENIPSVEKKAEEKDWKSFKIPGKHLIFAGSFVLIFFIVFLSFFSLFKSEHIEVVVKAPHEHIEEALAKFNGVQYSFNPASGKLFLAGHVLTSVDYQEMRYNLAQIPTIRSTEDNVVIDEYVWKSMSEVLTGNTLWRGVNIVAPSPGEFVVHGYVQSVEQATLLADYLNINFPYPDRLVNKVAVEDTLNVQIQSMLQAKGFSSVAFQLSAGDLIMLGRYGENQEQEYKELVSSINKLEGVHSVKNLAVPVSPTQARVDLSEQYKVTGSSLHDHQGYSAIINGRIFTLNDSLDGMKITGIEPTSILLEKDGLKYKIDYGSVR